MSISTHVSRWLSAAAAGLILLPLAAESFAADAAAPAPEAPAAAAAPAPAAPDARGPAPRGRGAAPGARGAGPAGAPAPGAPRGRGPAGAPANANYTLTRVWFYSEGVRCAADLFKPKDLKEGEKRPAIIMSHGWGGNMVGLGGIPPRFAAEGFIVFAFDYRGWGQSEAPLVKVGDLSAPDAEGNVTAKVKPARNVVDPWMFTTDITHAFDYMMGEPGVDTENIGYWGSSYSGGHAVWVGANEPRADCVVGQVPAANSQTLMTTSWKGQDDNIAETVKKRAIARARGEISPLPMQGEDKAPNLTGWTYMEKAWSYMPVDMADKVKAPMLLIDAANEELYDRKTSGELAYTRAKAAGAEAEYFLIPDIVHYGIYRGEPLEIGYREALRWYNKYLKDGK